MNVHRLTFKVTFVQSESCKCYTIYKLFKKIFFCKYCVVTLLYFHT